MINVEYDGCTPATPLDVSEVKIRLVEEVMDGFVGWASCVLNGKVYLNNIAIRRSDDGELVLIYPSKKNTRNQRYFFFNPITRDAKRILDDAILGKLTAK